MRQLLRAALGAHQCVVCGRTHKRGGRRRRNPVDGLCLGRVVGVKKHRLRIGVVGGEEVIRAGQADPARQLVRGVAGGPQPTRIQRQHGCVVGARAVAHHKHTLRVAAPLRRVAQAPRQRLGAVHQKVGVTPLGVQAVVGHQRQHTAGRERLAHKRVVGPLAAVPRPAVEEHHHRPAPGRRGALGLVDVELLARQRAIGHAGLHRFAGRGRERIEHAHRRTPAQPRCERHHACGPQRPPHRSGEAAVGACDGRGGHARDGAARRRCAGVWLLRGAGCFERVEGVRGTEGVFAIQVLRCVPIRRLVQLACVLHRLWVPHRR